MESQILKKMLVIEMILIEKELLQFEVCEVCGCLLPVGVDGSRLGRIYSSVSLPCLSTEAV